MDLANKLEMLSFGVESEGLNGFRVINRIHFQANEEYFLSVQASEFHYCIPRKLLDFSEYSHLEVMAGVPFEDIPKHWEQYDAGGGNVYSCVPKEEIQSLLIELDKKYKVI